MVHLSLSRRAASVSAALLVLATCGYFINTHPNWNVLSQFALTSALVERRTFMIDRYHGITGDKSFFDGHYYTDKSAVTPMLGVPPLFIYRRALNYRRTSTFSDGMALYWTTLGSVGIAAALVAGWLTSLLMRRGVGGSQAAAAAAMFIAGTPLLGYSILFYGYLPALALALTGYAAIDAPLLAGASAERRSWRRFFGAGLLLGLATWALQTLAVVACVLTLVVLWSSRDVGWRRAWRERLLPWAVGGFIGAAGYLVYNYAIFGTFASPYSHHVNEMFRERMSRGLMGATWPPRLTVAWLVTFHPYQGLFFWFPLSLLAAIGCLVSAVRRRSPGGRPSLAQDPLRRDGVIALAIFAVLLAYNSAYYMWWGGWAYAPRHLIPALPFLALGLAPLLRSARRGLAAGLFCVGTISIVINVSAVSVDPQPPPGLPKPVQEELLMAVSEVGTWPITMLELQRQFWSGKSDDNWGHRWGLEGVASLAPLLGAWLVAMAVLFTLARRPTAHSQAP